MSETRTARLVSDGWVSNDENGEVNRWSVIPHEGMGMVSFRWQGGSRWFRINAPVLRHMAEVLTDLADELEADDEEAVWSGRLIAGMSMAAARS